MDTAKEKKRRGLPPRDYVETLWGKRYSIPEVSQMLKDGKTVTSISKEFGLSRQRLSTLLNRAGVNAWDVRKKRPLPDKKELPTAVPKKCLLQITEAQHQKIKTLDNPQEMFRAWIDSLEPGDKPPRRQDSRTRGIQFRKQWMFNLTPEQHAKTRTIWNFRQKAREWIESL